MSGHSETGINVVTKVNGRKLNTRRTEVKRNVDPWLLIIPCQNGHICPWGEDLLAACTSHRRFVVRDLVAAGCTIVQDGDDGVNATFPVQAFDEVAEIMKPWKRRRMSDEQRQAAVERLRRHREKAGAYEGASQETLERPISTSADVCTRRAEIEGA